MLAQSPVQPHPTDVEADDDDQPVITFPSNHGHPENIVNVTSVQSSASDGEGGNVV